VGECEIRQNTWCIIINVSVFLLFRCTNSPRDFGLYYMSKFGYCGCIFEKKLQKMVQNAPSAAKR